MASPAAGGRVDLIQDGQQEPSHLIGIPGAANQVADWLGGQRSPGKPNDLRRHAQQAWRTHTLCERLYAFVK
jgi:hypothetical protein